MKKLMLAIALAAVLSTSGVVLAQSNERSVAGAASGSLPPAAMLGAIPVSSVDLGTGVRIEADGSAAGWFHAVLYSSVAGQSRPITVEARITQGGSADGAVSFSGSGTLDLGDGTPAIPVGMLTVTTGESGLVVAIDAATLPVSVNSGTVAVE